MIELPKLSESIVRLHALRWNELIKSHGFTGDHLKWHQLRDRRHEAARPACGLAPPPPTSVGSGRLRSTVAYYGAQGEPISHAEWRQKQLAAWAARESDPDIIDSIGIVETVELAKARFEGIVGDYLTVWADTNGNSDEFTRWLEAIRHSVGCEVGDLWRQGEWHAAWFERACRRKVHDQLAASVDEWKSRASGLEIQHLENPHLSLRSLRVAAGDLNFAVTFEQGEQTIKGAQRLLADLHTTDSTTIGERPSPTEGVEHGSTQQEHHTRGADDDEVLPNPGTLVNRSDASNINLSSQPQQKERGGNVLPSAVASTAPEEASAAPPEDDGAFASKAHRIDALATYTKLLQCSEAALARTAKVDPADLSKWKKGSLSAASDKKARIERVLKNQEAPTPPPKRGRES